MVHLYNTNRKKKVKKKKKNAFFKNFFSKKNFFCRVYQTHYYPPILSPFFLFLLSRHYITTRYISLQSLPFKYFNWIFTTLNHFFVLRNLGAFIGNIAISKYQLFASILLILKTILNNAFLLEHKRKRKVKTNEQTNLFTIFFITSFFLFVHF